MILCNICQHKINKIFIEMYTCKCKKVYCSAHMHKHVCTFDYLSHQQKILREKMPVIKSNKGLIKI